MRIKLAAIALAVSLLSAPFAITPAFALTQDEVKAACAIGPTECQTAVKTFIAENKTNAAVIIALVRALSTDTTIPGANIAAGVAVVVAETKTGGVLNPTGGAPLFNPTQVAALENIQVAVNNNGTPAAIQTAALPPEFSST